MSAFRLAAAAGADLIEFDVHLTADDEVVVIHDDTLERTTDGTGHVRDHTLARIRSLEASYGRATYAGERVPTLAEVAEWARGTNVALAVEIKQPDPSSGRPVYPRIAELVASVLVDHRMVDRSLVHSFDHSTVRRMRELLPRIATGVLHVPLSTDAAILALPSYASGVHAHWSSVGPDLCRAAHEAEMHVHAWGLPDAPAGDLLGSLIEAGVDSLDTGDPSWLRARLAGHAAAGTSA